MGLPNVSVSAYTKSADGEFWNPTAVSGSTKYDGTYEIGGLKAGTYRIGFRDYQGGHLSEYWDNATVVDAATDIVVGDSATVAGRTPELAKGSHITGKVTGPDGEALRNVMVQAYRKAPGQDYWGMGSMGASTRAGGTTTSAASPGYLPPRLLPTTKVDTSASSGTTRQTSSGPTDIVVGESATVSGKNAQLAQGAHITGEVTGPNVSVSPTSR